MRHQIRIDVDVVYVSVIKKDGRVIEFLVDLEDFEKHVKPYKWYIGKDGYVKRDTPKPRKVLYLHRVILNSPTNLKVDHISGVRHDNRKKNLRFCTESQNQHNRGVTKRSKSGYKGVWFFKQLGRWQSQIKLNYKSIHLGYFDTAEKAYAAYCEAAKKYHKEFARF
jgi:hypothetical protein